MNTAFSFILVLGLLIFVHELGHFVFAKLFGVRVLKFSLGFGPRLFGKVIGDTDYVVSAIPLGGYVKMFGENPDEQDVPPGTREVSFAHKKVWQRFGIVFAGPAFNFLFTLVLFFFLFLFNGVPESIDTTQVGRVNESSPAAQAGVLDNDVIVEINGKITEKWMDVLNAVKDSGGEKLSMVVLRDGKEVKLAIIPQVDDVKNIYGEKVDERYMIGIVRYEELKYIPAGPFGALESAAKQTWGFVMLTVTGFVKIVQRVIPMSELGGPILIAQIAGQQMEAGWINLMYFMGLLSVNLGVLNLLPIPVLDGGHLMFLSIESVRRKPMDERAQIIAQQIGIALLGTLMVFVFYNDILRLFK
ncbi:RIP metalloprotease RseP [Desulfosediminicola flagellatus]|uniref:RIP metalloprotease RseP n=1 Tax=Desulfosediminicola flagellatus TaxID=2569541 RepID=UPI0010AD4E0F|nr:RIP metalloprotease RseP [Desulfosediminicola flagellatus]